MEEVNFISFIYNGGWFCLNGLRWRESFIEQDKIVFLEDVSTICSYMSGEGVLVHVRRVKLSIVMSNELRWCSGWQQILFLFYIFDLIVSFIRGRNRSARWKPPKWHKLFKVVSSALRNRRESVCDSFISSYNSILQGNIGLNKTTNLM